MSINGEKTLENHCKSIEHQNKSLAEWTKFNEAEFDDCRVVQNFNFWKNLCIYEGIFEIEKECLYQVEYY